MSRRTKIWLIVAAVLVVVGAAIFAAASAEGLSTVQYETNIHAVGEAFRDISIEADTADIAFLPSEDGSCRVVCHEAARETHTVSVENETLRIRVSNEGRWFDYISISFESPALTIYLPETDYSGLRVNEDTGDIAIPEGFSFDSIALSTSTGDIRIDGASTNTLDLSVSTGKVVVTDVACGGDVKIAGSTGDTELRDVSCKNLISTGNTGNLSLKNVLAAEQFSIERSTGDINFDGCDAAELSVETDTGHVTGTLRSEKIFLVESDTGSIEVPRSATGGRCEIRTATGDIRIEIP